MLALSDENVANRLATYKSNLKQKIVDANAELAKLQYKYKV